MSVSQLLINARKAAESEQGGELARKHGGNLYSRIEERIDELANLTMQGYITNKNLATEESNQYMIKHTAIVTNRTLLKHTNPKSSRWLLGKINNPGSMIKNQLNLYNKALDLLTGEDSLMDIIPNLSLQNSSVDEERLEDVLFILGQAKNLTPIAATPSESDSAVLASTLGLGIDELEDVLPANVDSEFNNALKYLDRYLSQMRRMYDILRYDGEIAEAGITNKMFF